MTKPAVCQDVYTIYGIYVKGCLKANQIQLL